MKEQKLKRIKLIRNTDDNNELLEPLSPRKRAQKEIYETILEEKLNNNENYNNIALNGVYGSGKSSILKSLDCLKKKRTLRVSLAKVESDEKNDAKNLSFVQYKILKQIVSQIKKDKVALLDIDNYKEYSFCTHIIYIVFVFTFFFGICTLINNTDIFNLSSDSLIKSTAVFFCNRIKVDTMVGLLFVILIMWICEKCIVDLRFKFKDPIGSIKKSEILIYFVITGIVCFGVLSLFKNMSSFDFGNPDIIYAFCLIWFIYILKTFISYLDRMKKIKNINLTLKKVNFDFSDKNNNETVHLLNNWSEIIFYCLKMTNTNIIIFEDLDRLERKDIFWELKELNNTLNQKNNQKARHYNPILFNRKSPILIKENTYKFIYVIRDNMFNEEEKTKLFDIIIPVVPILNNENTCQHFLQNISAVEVAGKRITDYLDMEYCLRVIRNINDMRTLNDFLNEFFIYLEASMDKGWNLIENDINVIFSLILYKVFFEDDYTKLLNNKGILFDCINDINKKYEEDTEIDNLTKEINKKIFDIRAVVNTEVLKDLDCDQSCRIEMNSYGFDYHILSFYSQFIMLIENINEEIGIKVIEKQSNKCKKTKKVKLEKIKIQLDKHLNDIQDLKENLIDHKRSNISSNFNVDEWINDLFDSETLRKIDESISSLITGNSSIDPDQVEKIQNLIFQNEKHIQNKKVFKDLIESGYLDTNVFKYLTYASEVIIREEDLSLIDDVLYSDNPNEIDIPDSELYSIYNIISSQLYINNAYFNSKIINVCLMVNDDKAKKIIKNTLTNHEDKIYDDFWEIYLTDFEKVHSNHNYQKTTVSHFMELIFDDDSIAKYFLPFIFTYAGNKMIKVIFKNYKSKILEKEFNFSDFDMNRIISNLEKVFDKKESDLITVDNDIWKFLNTNKLKLKNISNLSINVEDFVDINIPLGGILEKTFRNLSYLIIEANKKNNDNLHSILVRFIESDDKIIVEENKIAYNVASDVFQYIFDHTYISKNLPSYIDDVYNKVFDRISDENRHQFKIKLLEKGTPNRSKDDFLNRHKDLLHEDDIDRITSKIPKTTDHFMDVMKFNIKKEIQFEYSADNQ